MKNEEVITKEIQRLRIKMEEYMQNRDHMNWTLTAMKVDALQWVLTEEAEQ